MLTSLNSRVIIAQDVLLRRVGAETVVLNLKSQKYLGLDEMATEMWQAVTGCESLQAAYEKLMTEFDVGADELRRDLEAFVDELSGLGLVDIVGRP